MILYSHLFRLALLAASTNYGVVSKLAYGHVLFLAGKNLSRENRQKPLKRVFLVLK